MKIAPAILCICLFFAIPASAQWTTHGMNIPLAHPRLFWNATRLSAAQTWLAANPFTAATDRDKAFQAYVNNSNTTSCAASVVNDEVAFLVPTAQWQSTAIGSDAYRTAENNLLVFDWCYGSFSTSSPSGTTTLGVNSSAGLDQTIQVASSTNMVVGNVLTLGGTGSEYCIIEAVPDGTHVQCQSLVSGHTSGITITLQSQRDSMNSKWLTWSSNIAAQSWGGIQNGGMIMNNYYWGNMRSEFEIGVITYGDPVGGSGAGSSADNLIDFSLVSRWHNQIIANAVMNGQISGGMPQEGTEYGGAQFGYWIFPLMSAKNMGRDLSTETNFFKQLLYDALYLTTPAKTFIKDFNVTQWQMNFWSDDEVTANQGGILYGRSYLEDGMNVFSQLYSSINAGKYARQWLNSLPTVAPLNLDPYATGTHNYYVSNDLLSGDPGGSASGYTGLPLDLYSTGFQTGVMKKAWDTSSSYVFYEFNFPDNVGHAHDEWGDFDFWRNGKWLTRKTITYTNIVAGEPNINANANMSDTGGYDITNNLVAFTNVALGLDSNAGYDRPTVRMGAPAIKRLETQSGYAYVVADTTNTYLWDAGHSSFNTGVVSSLVRELLYIRSLETLIVFDREVTAAQTHGGSTTAANVVTTSLHHYEVSPTQDGGASDYVHWTETNGTQVLRQTILLPTGLSASNPRLINEATCGGCSAVGQYRLDVDASGAATRYHLSCLQARDTSGSNLTCSVVDSNSGNPNSGTFTITLHPSVGSDTTVVFNKGATSSGGTINIAGAGVTSLTSSIESISYTDNGPVWGGTQVSTPTFSPIAGAYGATQNVTISSTTVGATICYTTDGTMPTEVSNSCSGGTTLTYSSPVAVSSSKTLNAIGTLAGSVDSAVGTAGYTIGTSAPAPQMMVRK